MDCRRTALSGDEIHGIPFLPAPFYSFIHQIKAGGKSFTTPVKVSKAVSCAVENRNGWAAKRWSGGGDYFGFAAKADGSFHLVWSDNRSGKFELYQAQVSTSEK